jgi:hypothetical protein
MMRDYIFQVQDAIARTHNTLEASDVAYHMVSTVPNLYENFVQL